MTRRASPEEKALVVQRHQLDRSRRLLDDADAVMDELDGEFAETQALLGEMLDIAEGLRAGTPDREGADAAGRVEALVERRGAAASGRIPPLAGLATVEAASWTWEDCLASMEEYADGQGVDLTGDPFDSLLTDGRRAEIARWFAEDFSSATVNCDRYDYMIAGTCGLIGGLIDGLFVGIPGMGALGRMSDRAVEEAVKRFAVLVGGNEKGKDKSKWFIEFLESRYKVNYDHRYGADVGHMFKMSTSDHHLKSLAHSPDLVGLFFSILDQFTGNAHFADSGRIISIKTEPFEPEGANLVARIFMGFATWFGHLCSDVAGSSGAEGRGSGVPIPFYSLFQFMVADRSGRRRRRVEELSVSVFQKGYDFRHGLALAAPVVVTELLTRLVWGFKQCLCRGASWNACVLEKDSPELRRMLLVAHGALCFADGCDAGLRSGGDILQLLLRFNLAAWSRFGLLMLKEVGVWYRADGQDGKAVNAYLEREYRRMSAWKP